MAKTSTNKDQRLFMRVDSEFLKQIDEWRRQQPDIPTRSEAIRRLVENGLRSALPGHRRA
jgi:hypothetical protein